MYMQGNASGGDSAKYAGKGANILVDRAWEFINRRTVLPERPPLGNFFC